MTSKLTLGKRRVPCTEVFIIDKSTGRILLGLKKRGVSTGLFLGFGGKLEQDETILHAAQRELQEESGLIASIEDLQFQGQLQYEMSDKILESSLYFCTKFTGIPTECDEMKPTWFHLAEIPYDSMYEDVQHWMPILLGNLTEADVEGKRHIQFQVTVVASADDSRFAKSILIKRITNIEHFEGKMGLTCDSKPIFSINSDD